jgi:hypothetical protein
VITFVIREDLGFVLQASEGIGIDDPVSISLEFRSSFVFLFWIGPAGAVARLDGVGS